LLEAASATVMETQENVPGDWTEAQKRQTELGYIYARMISRTNVVIDSDDT
jgi:hypothetical protein